MSKAKIAQLLKFFPKAIPSPLYRVEIPKAVEISLDTKSLKVDFAEQLTKKQVADLLNGRDSKISKSECPAHAVIATPARFEEVEGLMPQYVRCYGKEIPVSVLGITKDHGETFVVAKDLLRDDDLIPTGPR